MDVLSRAEDTVLSMHSEDDYGRPDVLTSMSYLRSAFPVEESRASMTLSGPEQAMIALRQTSAAQSLRLWKCKDRTVTKAAGLIMCLYPWTPPPDAEPRNHQSPIQVCWLDTSHLQLKPALDAIGVAMHAQYEGSVALRLGGRRSAPSTNPSPPAGSANGPPRRKSSPSWTRATLTSRSSS